MTTIAFRDGVMAADRRLGIGGKRGLTSTKICYIREFGIEFVVGASGASTYTNPFLDWVRAGMQMEKRPVLDPESDGNDGMAALVYDVQTEKLRYFFTAKSGHLCMDEVEAEYWAIGSGSGMALGAMAIGATAGAAVEAAAVHDTATGDGIDLLYGPGWKVVRA